MLQQMESFLAYFEGIRRRTSRYVQTLPPEHVDWSPRAGEFSAGDIVRHLAAAEQMYTGVVVAGIWRYPGHERSAYPTLAAALSHLESSHAEATAALRAAGDGVLHERRPTLDGPDVSAWRLLMAMVEHEVHHRSQLASYLLLLDVSPPQIYGMGVEDVIARATG